MQMLANHPIAMFVTAFFILWWAAYWGEKARLKRIGMEAEEREDLGMILGSTLTLLGLIIGFTFSMAISRYDQRKNYEEEEANAIGTEYVRADLLPADSAEKVRLLLREYAGERIKFYVLRWQRDLDPVNVRTAELQDQMWKAVLPATHTDRSAIDALVVSGMNDVINRQGYTQAAWWNRIPLAAWGLMWAIAVCCNLMIGYFVRPQRQHWLRLAVFPLIVAISFLLIADIDSPRYGIIKVKPQNLVSLQEGMK